MPSRLLCRALATALAGITASAVIATSASAASPTTTKPPASVTQPTDDSITVLGGGLLSGAYSADYSPEGDEYVTAVLNAKAKTLDLYVTSALSCVGTASTIRTTYSAKGLKLTTGTVTATLPTEAMSYTGTLKIAFTLSADRASATMAVAGGTLVKKSGPKLSCTASKANLQLRLAHPDASMPVRGKALAGRSYVGSVAGSAQRTTFLTNVSADGRSVTNRQVELFVDCVAKKPYEYLRLNDWARYPIDASGHFEFHETWSDNGAKLGVDAAHTIEITTSTKGGFDGVRAAGVVRFDVRVLDAKTGAVLDTCTSADQVFEAHAI
jgi:hypothetical protein